jgi:hypothetical protein
VKLLELLNNVDQSLGADPAQVELRSQLQQTIVQLKIAQQLAPNNSLLRELTVMREGFTGTGKAVCACCGRPF